MDINNELLIQAIKLYLMGGNLDNGGFNSMIEYAPLIARKLADSYNMNIGEFRQYLSKKRLIDIDDIKHVIFKTTFGEHAVLIARIVLERDKV